MHERTKIVYDALLAAKAARKGGVLPGKCFE